MEEPTRNLPTEAAAVMAAYLHLLDERIPWRITGLYLVGSLALDDYQSGQSDVDLVAVSDTSLTPAELVEVGQLHRELRRAEPRPGLDGVYVTWSELQAEPAGLSAPYCLDGRFAPGGGFAANPVTWCVLHRYPLALRGPAKPVVWHRDEALRQWCRENLDSYWAGWVQGARRRPLRQLYSLSRQAVVWGVLGVTRLHATIRTGDILSKSAAGTYALQVFPARWSPIIYEALGSRLGRKLDRYGTRFSRRRDALAFMEYVLADARK
jgi:hypothetical protein